MAIRQGASFGVWGWIVVTQWVLGASALYQGGGLTILTQNRLDSKLMIRHLDTTE